MWGGIARFILRYRLILLLILSAALAVGAYKASQVQLSYEYTRAIPTDNPKYIAFEEFHKKYGEDGNLFAIGVQTDKFFQKDFFNNYVKLNTEVRKIPGVDAVLSVPDAVILVKDTASEKLIGHAIFPKAELTQQALDSGRSVFENQVFYQGLLYNRDTKTYMMAVNVNKNVMASAARTVMVNAILKAGDDFGKANGVTMHYSGLPLIRTQLAVKVATEMKYFLLGSVGLSALILLIFFRSLSTTFLSLTVVIIGVIFSLATMSLLHYKITLLNALIPPLIVVIGIPNCIYFLNKYHTSFLEYKEKNKALEEMIKKMGIVTLFCNIAAAIGFGVFALTKSAILREFGAVAGINIMLLFIISVILLPAALSYLPDPKPRHMRYLSNLWLTSFLSRLERWAIHRKATIYVVTTVIVLFSIAGIMRLRSESFILDDLPKTDKLFTDLKFFESNFRGVMPLEIMIDTKRKNGLRANMLNTFGRIDSLAAYVQSIPVMGRPLSLVEGLKFVRQAYYDNDSTRYGLPNEIDLGFLAPYLNMKGNDSSGSANSVTRLANSFIDKDKQTARISVNMADVGSLRLPKLLDSIQKRSGQLFDSSKYKITLTGTTVTFLEGSAFIINGLRQSIIWAFVLIAACMLYLFRSVRILVCSLLPNVIPLVITAGVMGWAGVPLKPSTVLVFSIALGIAIDITIRFLVNYKQDAKSELGVEANVVHSIHSTGISIIYTSLVLIAGFVIFCFSGFGGTQALGWLTSLTLVMATLTNLVFLPA